MVEHVRHHRDTSALDRPPRGGMGQHTEAVLDGYQKIEAIASLVESVILWRGAYLARYGRLDQAEALLFRLLFKEGSRNPQAQDLLARVYFQQGKTSQALDLWRQSAALQPGNPALKRTLALASLLEKGRSRGALLFAHRLKLALGALALGVLCVGLGWGGVQGVRAVDRWLQGPEPPAVALEGRFTCDVASMEQAFEGIYPVSFTRRRIGSGANLGRLEVMVEQKGDEVRAFGTVPTLFLRYQVEQALREIPGVRHLDLKDLTVERSYHVKKGESLWVISRKIYGEGQSWTVLSRFNQLDRPDRLKVGQRLELPLGDEELIPDS